MEHLPKRASSKLTVFLLERDFRTNLVRFMEHKPIGLEMEDSEFQKIVETVNSICATATNPSLIEGLLDFFSFYTFSLLFKGRSAKQCEELEGFLADVNRQNEKYFFLPPNRTAFLFFRIEIKNPPIV